MLHIDLTKNCGVDPVERMEGRRSVGVWGQDGEATCKRAKPSFSPVGCQ